MILCVTGNRALAERPDAERWARWRGARGPDTWAHDIALSLAKRRVVFDGTGVCIDDLHGARPWCRPGDMPTSKAIPADWSAWYLHRDRVMVRWVARHAEVAGGATVLCLRAPWSRTNGAGYTAARATALGLSVINLEFR